MLVTCISGVTAMPSVRNGILALLVYLMVARFRCCDAALNLADACVDLGLQGSLLKRYGLNMTSRQQAQCTWDGNVDILMNLTFDNSNWRNDHVRRAEGRTVYIFRCPGIPPFQLRPSMQTKIHEYFF